MSVVIRNLKLALPPGGDRPYAVDGVSFELIRRQDPLRGRANPAPASRCARMR